MLVTATYAVSYQWYQNNVALAGETNSVLIISDTEPANAGVYQCAVIGVGGALNTVMSGSATLGVLIPLPGASQVVNFATASGGTVQDENGNGIGLSAYFPGTGGGTTGEPNPNMDLAGGVLTLDNNSADWNGANTSLLTAPALDLATIGFTGSQDFNATVHFGAITDWAWDDQAGLMIGDNINGLTRAGYVGNWWFTPSTTAFSGYDTVAAGNADEYVNDGPAINMSENLIVTVGRKAGTWYWTINGESDILTSPWYGGVQPTGLNNTPNLNATTDMWAGFYVDSPQGTSVGVPYTVESFAARVFAPPQILASKNGSTLNLSWNVVGLGLVSSTDLVTWTPVPGTAGVSSLAVTIPATGNRYYGIAPLP